jgi:signal recognition particle receptor subunit beta
MVLINKAINEVTVKLVYYGPGLCGKTTNLEKIYGNPKLEHKGKMISMSTETDRTLFFDFMPMELGTIAGQKVRVQLYTVPGQVFYDATRKLVLRGTDGVVFVADSQESMRGSNLDSLENLKANLRVNRIDPDKVALIFQYNKRDLPGVDSVEQMNEYLNPGNSPVVEASAIQGAGVTATLRAAVARILDNLKANVDVTLYEQPELSAPDMSQRAGVTPSSAGTPKLSLRTDVPAAPPRKTDTAPVSLPPDVLEPIAVSPFAQAEPEHSSSPFDVSFDAVDVAVDATVDEDPFADMPAVDPAPAPSPVAVRDEPFASPAAAVHDTSAERVELEMLLANARSLIASLEIALDRAHENERMLSEKLARL